jgi:hypothetical protein
MVHDRIIQLIALVVLVIGVGASGALLPRIVDDSDRYALRYTDVTVESAPPIVELGRAIGALRGLIVDYLWIKVHIQKEKGLFYEVMADADMITKLQPRFAAVWAFHGHNMAYNISVATHTQEERWDWVNAGIRLVRNEGIRYNPNDLLLHKELAFWFAHKIDGYADDAHLYYKAQFAREWHLLLGRPPDDYEARIAWIKEIADAPETLAAADQQTPGVRALVDELRANYPPAEEREFRLDSQFLNEYAMWQAVTQQSAVAELVGAARRFRESSQYFATLDRLASDPELEQQWTTLIAHLRKRALIDEYNMDPQLMYEYTRDLGPLDWRHAQAHAVYWARRGSQFGEARVADDEIYRMINNDRIQLQGLQGLARTGRIIFDPFSSDVPARLPDPRWIEPIYDMFEELTIKYYYARGAGSDTFVAFLQNFMGSAIREAYRAGETARAQEMLDRLDRLFGSGAIISHQQYKMPLDVWVWKETKDNYDQQPHLAPSEVAAGLRHGFIVGIGYNQPEVLRDAIQFADKVTEYFKGNRYFDFENKFGRGRMKELIAELERTAEAVLFSVMVDRSIPLEDRITIWNQVDQYIPSLRARVYDQLKPALAAELQSSVWSRKYGIDDVLSVPPDLEIVRVRMAEERRQREQELEEMGERDTIERQ